MRILIVGMVLIVAVWWIVIGEYQVGIVVINDNIWFLCRPIFGDYLHVGFVIRSRVRVRLLVGSCEVIIHSVEAAIIDIVHIR